MSKKSFSTARFLPNNSIPFIAETLNIFLNISYTAAGFSEWPCLIVLSTKLSKN